MKLHRGWAAFLVTLALVQGSSVIAQQISPRRLTLREAIELALKMIGAEIYTREYHRSKLLMWEKPGRGYGFPVPASLRELLIGDDTNYF